MSQIFKDLKPYAQNNRNVFDLTRTSTFSSKSGMIQPCFIQETVPDGKYKIDVNGIIRTLPMQTANFTTLKANMEFFFVPYSQLWNSFNQFFYGRGDQHRSPSGAITLDLQPISTPNFDYRRVCLELCSAAVQQLYYDYMIKYLNYLDTFDALSMFTEVAAASRNDAIQAFVRYRTNLHLFIDAMVKGYVDYQLPSDIMSIRNIHFADVHGRMCATDMVRLFDLLGYANLLPFYKLYWTWIYEHGHYETIYETTFGYDVATSRLTIHNDNHSFYYDAQANAVGQIFVMNIYDLDLESTDPTASADSAASSLSTSIMSRFTEGIYHYLPSIYKFIPQVSPNPFRVMAFFKIWNDFYRNAQYDNLPYHTLFNADYITGSSTNNFEYTRLLRMLVPNYHQYKKDRFTGSYPDSQFGDVAVAGLNNPTKIVNSGYGTSVGMTNIDGSTSVSTSDRKYLANMGYQSEPASTDWNINSGVSVLAIRQAEALQRWKEKILRAGNREKDLQDAIFGVKSKYIEDGYVDFLGSCDGTINVNPVAATASTDSAEIGELGAFAVGNISGKEIEYDAKDFGIIMGVLYVMPETKYDAFGLDPFNAKTLPDDYYKPDFQNLGLAPVYSSDFNIFNLIETVDGVEQSNIKVLGYLSRYYEYKTSLNKVHGEFFGSNPVLNALQRGMIAGLDISGNLENLQNILANCAAGVDSSLVSVRDVRDFEAMTLSALYCNPDDVNSLFYQASDPGLWSDQFKYEVQFTTKAILPMSVDGLPY